MPEETNNQAPVTDDGGTAVVDQSPEAVQQQEQLERENNELKARLEQQAQEAAAFREATLKMMAQPQGASVEKPQNEEAELTAEFKEVGYDDAQAARMAKTILKREARLLERVVPRDQYARDAQAFGQFARKAADKEQVDRLMAEGYSREDALRADKWVQDETKSGRYFHEAQDAFDLAVIRLKIAKAQQENGEDGELKARQARGNFHGASRSGGRASGPIIVPKAISEKQGANDDGFLKRTKAFLDKFSPEEKARRGVQWE